MQKERFMAHVGHDDRFGALHDSADDPLADLVPGAHAIGGDADPRLDVQLVAVGIAEDERALQCVVMSFEHLEHAMKRASELVGAA